MRAGSQDYGLFCDEEGKFVGILLGHDYCAEHEWGYDGIKRMFGIPEMGKKTLGIKSRSATQTPKNIIFKEEKYKKEKFALLYTNPSWRGSEDAEKYIPFDLEDYKSQIKWRVDYDKKKPREGYKPKDPISTAWSSDGFGVGVMGEENITYLRDLFEAIAHENITIAHVNSSPNNPFGRSSLAVMIKDRIPQNFIDMMYAADKEQYDLVEYEKKIGLTKLKEKTRGNGHAKLHYYVACSARWINYEDKEAREKEKAENNTKYDIMYWINYSDDDSTHGYYTVEEIMKWLKGKEKLTVVAPRKK